MHVHDHVHVHVQVGLVAFRDPHGIRPLVIGKRPSADASGIEWAIASEDCAFGPIAFERVRDVQPGEMVIITSEGQLVSKQVRGQQTGQDRMGAGTGPGDYGPACRDTVTAGSAEGTAAVVVVLPTVNLQCWAASVR